MTLRAWIIYGQKEAEKNCHYIDLYKKEGKKRGITFELLLTERLTLGSDGTGCYLLYDRKRLENPDFAIVRTIYPLLSFHLEEMGIPIYNNSMVASICNDKARTCQFLAARGIPCIPTVFCRHTEVENRLYRKAEEEDNLDRDIGIHLTKDLSETVVKTVDGHGGSQVFLASDQDGVLTKSGYSDFVIQPKVQGKGQDIRVYVIGNEIIAAVCRTVQKKRKGSADSSSSFGAAEDFRANFSLGGKVSLYTLSQAERELVKKISSFFSFGMVGIDFLVDCNGEFIFNEIEDVVGARMLYQCSDINLVGRYLDYIITQVK